ncbi:DUF2161 family putative PD-(D/E)XK-type phosphodiesterase [Paenibacillus tianjinensis]|uniref:Restriction endonuclease n=1 Tax=Paenibacillus tianjinensis TaxID=2810347 RepID=A0ABX7LI08_9BACL|nr:DUF2161 family putative PD-(D/E)XK-type phosphodiesterase [Paenibacillus tianjinensis]QSF46513.1 hypothetical protein JRJ22_08045 [Paenibacillus tianjinensis]
MAVKHETELYAPLKAFFERQGYSIKGEVRTCDLVGLREGEELPLIVEMKKTFNLALLLQGVERLRLSPNVYLAVERVRDKKGAVNQRWGELSGLCRRLGLGLITIVFYKTKAPLVEVLAEPGDAPPQVRSGARRREKLLYEFRERSGDYNTGGSTRVKLVTAYREKALRVALALQALEAEAALGLLDGRAKQSRAPKAGAAAPAEGPAAAQARAGITPAELRRRSGVPGAAAMLQRNYYGWFTRVNRGRYALTPAGTAALLEYAAIAEVSAGKH